jgi:hypothetical protein
MASNAKITLINSPALNGAELADPTSKKSTMLTAERFEDMSQRGRLRVIQQNDGDVIVGIVEDPDGPNGGVTTSVEFCTSGGKSPKTLIALRSLMQAMAEDNADSPHCHRRGEQGLGVTVLIPK